VVLFKRYLQGIDYEVYHALSFIRWYEQPDKDPIIEIPSKGYYVNYPYFKMPSHRFSKQMLFQENRVSLLLNTPYEESRGQSAVTDLFFILDSNSQHIVGGYEEMVSTYSSENGAEGSPTYKSCMMEGWDSDNIL